MRSVGVGKECGNNVKVTGQQEIKCGVRVGKGHGVGITNTCINRNKLSKSNCVKGMYVGMWGGV